MKVPKEILRLIELSKWKATTNCDLDVELRELCGWHDSIKLCSGPNFNDGGLKACANGECKDLYGVYLTGDYVDSVKKSSLNADKCLMLGFNWDEESICLDYRFSENNPRIMASQYFVASGNWIEIASSVEDLIEKLGIKTNYSTM